MLDNGYAYGISILAHRLTNPIALAICRNSYLMPVCERRWISIENKDNRFALKTVEDIPSAKGTAKYQV